METLERIKEALLESFSSFGEGIASYVPLIISALVVLLIGWIISRVFAGIVHRSLKAIHFDKGCEKIGVDKLLHKIKNDLSPSKVLSKAFYWLIMLVFITSAANVLGWKMLTDGIAAFMSYLPTLGISLIIFFIGVYVAELIKTMVYTAANSIGISGAKPIANIVYYLLFIFIAITALNQAGINTDIITSNLTLIMGAVLFAFAISYGFASRNIVSNMLSSFYSKGKFRAGQTIRMGEVEGVIESIDSISVTLRTESGVLVIPSKELVDGRVAILGEIED